MQDLPLTSSLLAPLPPPHPLQHRHPLRPPPHQSPLAPFSGVATQRVSRRRARTDATSLAFSRPARRAAFPRAHTHRNASPLSCSAGPTDRRPTPMWSEAQRRTLQVNPNRREPPASAVATDRLSLSHPNPGWKSEGSDARSRRPTPHKPPPQRRTSTRCRTLPTKPIPQPPTTLPQKAQGSDPCGLRQGYRILL